MKPFTDHQAYLITLICSLVAQNFLLKSCMILICKIFGESLPRVPKGPKRFANGKKLSLKSF